MDLLCIQFFKRINFYPLKIHIYVYAHIDIIYSMIMISEIKNPFNFALFRFLSISLDFVKSWHDTWQF